MWVTFYFDLEVQKSNEPKKDSLFETDFDASKTRLLKKSLNNKKIKIMIVEDNKVNMLLKTILKNLEIQQFLRFLMEKTL
jgi:hypothetical protein